MACTSPPTSFTRASAGGSDASALREAVAYPDGELFHGLFFAGLARIDAVLLLEQAATTSFGVVLSARDLALVLANASVVAAAIVANYFAWAYLGGLGGTVAAQAF